MPIRVQDEQGNTHVFPDGSTPAMIAKAMKVKPPKGADVSAAPAPKARTAGNYASEIARGVGRGVKNLAEGMATTVANPTKALADLYNQTSDAVSAAGKEYRDNAAAPTGQRLAATALRGAEEAPIIGGMVQHAEQGGTKPGSPEAVGAAVEGATTFEAPGMVTRGVRAIAPRAVEAMTGTGPKATADLVKKTQTGNALADTHSRTQAAIETARNNALKEGNSKYNAVNEKLNPLPADMEAVHGLFYEAAESFGETQAEPPLLKRLGTALKNGDGFTYKDLQSIYSELGKELSKGTLSGTTYHAYDLMHEGIGKEMQRLADSQGQGAQLTGARNYWRRMKQAFGKPLNQNDVASSVLRSQSPEMAEQGETANRVRLMGSFDPEIPKAFSDLQKARTAAQGLPAPVPGETAKIGTEEIRQAKTEGLQKRAETVRKGGHRVASYGIGLKALWDTFHGNLTGVAEDIAVGSAAYGTAGLIAKALEKPSVVKFLTEPTAKDIAQIPPELRASMPQIVKAAQAKGIRVNPALAGIGAALAPRRPAQHPTDAWQGIQP